MRIIPVDDKLTNNCACSFQNFILLFIVAVKNISCFSPTHLHMMKCSLHVFLLSSNKCIPSKCNSVVVIQCEKCERNHEEPLLSVKLNWKSLIIFLYKNKHYSWLWVANSSFSWDNTKCKQKKWKCGKREGKKFNLTWAQAWIAT